MIVVDSTVWIDFFNGVDVPHVARLRRLMPIERLAVGDLMLCEILQGFGSEHHARAVEAHLRKFEIAAMVDDEIAVTAARYYRSLRRRGITVRKTVDLLIGAWCIEQDVPLLHNDRDFRPLARYFGLREVPVG